MNKLEFMRKTVVALLLWNVLLTAGLLLNVNNHHEDKLNQEICMLEEIPMEELK